jgi:hypothetical protein
VNCGTLGRSFGSPSRAPEFDQRVIVSISASLSRASPRKCPNCGSAVHGGIKRLTTMRRIDEVHGRVSW